MRVVCSIALFIVFTTVSVRSLCLNLNCSDQNVQSLIGDCRELFKRSTDVGGCYGHEKIFVNNQVFNNHGQTQYECPERYVFDSDMQCVRERWEPDSGPWETHHFIARGRRLVLELRQSSRSVKYRVLSLDAGK